MTYPAEKQLRHVFLTTKLTSAQLAKLVELFGQAVAYNATLADEVPVAPGQAPTGVMITVAPTYEEWG